MQTFRYRGASHFSIPGNTIVIHPDEVHDGAAGSENMLHYRMFYFPPELLLEASNRTRVLPFVKEPILSDKSIHQLLVEVLIDLNDEPDELLLDDIITRLHSNLWKHADGEITHPKTIAREAILNIREYLMENIDSTVSSVDLENASGLDRYTISRHFRAIHGTSPHRYLIMRRLEKGRRMLTGSNESLADIAVSCGFADQSHFTRHFKSAFGMTPGRWLRLTQR
ncbi:helix-turn-helix domain protein [Brucella rhizosphaerae]|uniref:Helix-turn-helix domain protein n=1 Tax=Brucella rhizosphaerae TaxID=571254 RepID=A0A256FH40_9HYPH|nr:helix-turn-helix domain protein [Brucella rhizosphaerae]